MGPFSFLQNSELSRPLYTASISAIEDSIGHPPCECPDCQTGFYAVQEQSQPQFSYCRHLSDDEAKGIIRSYVKQIKEARARLTGLLVSHADVVMQRWKKRSQDKRQLLLKSVAPDLEERQWILPRYSYMIERKLLHLRNQSRRRQLLLPWLSVEVLKTNPATLFALLHYRTRYPPQDWAVFDCRQITISWATGWLDVDYSAMCIVFYGPKYGDFVDWEAGAAHRGDILGFPRARLVIEAQAYLMETLCNIVDKILDGFDDTQPARTEKWRELTTTEGFKRIGEVERWSPYTNQAFSAPPRLDIAYLLSLAKTRLDAMGDHLWYLQCDVAYTRRHVKILLDTEHYKKWANTEVGAFLTKNIYREVLSYYWWRWVEIECRHVEQMHKQFGDNAYSGQPLPVRYDRALGALELLLVNQVIYRTKILSDVLPFAAGFSRYWSSQHDVALPQGSVLLSRNTPTNTKESLENDPLDWCLVQILGEPDKQTHFDHAMLFAFLHDHLATATSKEKARLDQVIYQKLSDISTCHEMLLSVRLHRPQNSSRSIEEVIESENREGWKRMKSEPPAVSKQAVETMGSALIEDFYQRKSPNGPKDMEWLRQSQVIRAALEKFWASMRAIIRHEFDGSAFSLGERDGLLQIISANLSPQYVDAVQSEKEMVLANVESVENLPQTRFEDQAKSSPKAELAIALPRQKIKTRPEKPLNEPGTDVEAPGLDPEAPGLDPEAHRATAISISVTRRASEVFALMFPCKEDVSKSVNWDSFVHAMTDVGFIPRNNGGSAVLFERNEELGGKIVFHKPHPIAKIDPIALRSMGKRMTKWFGWSRELLGLDDADNKS